MKLNPTDMRGRDVYNLMTDLIAPRPIAWASTLSTDGRANLAPFSYFNGVTSRPALISLCIGYRRGPDGTLAPKDTARNLIDTGEVVVHVVTEKLAEAMNITAGEFPFGDSELDRAGLGSTPSDLVKPPRIAEAPVAMECSLFRHVDLGEARIHMLVCRIERVHVSDDLVDEHGRIALSGLRAVGRVGVDGYCRAATDLFSMDRPAVKP